MATGEAGTKAPQTPYYVKALALGLPAYLVGVNLWTWVFTVSVFLGGRSDFRQLYAAGYMVRSGHAHELYDYEAQRYFQNKLVSRADMALPFVRPAYEALLFVPFSFLSYRSAYLTFLALNVILLSASYRLLRPKLGNLARIYGWLPAALFLAYLPVAAALIQGQDSVLLLLLFTLTLSLLERGNALAAGAILGLAAFKFQVVIPITLLVLFWRRWRFAAGVAITATLAALGSALLVGLTQAKIYVRSLLVFGTPSHHLGLLWYPIPESLLPILRGLIYGVADAHFPSAWITGITAALSLLVVFLVAGCRPRSKQNQDEFLLALLTSVLVSYYLLIHDLSVVLIPIAIILGQFIDSEATGDHTGRLLTRAAALMFVAPICESYIPQQFFVVALPLMMFLYVLANSFHRDVANMGLDVPPTHAAAVHS